MEKAKRTVEALLVNRLPRRLSRGIGGLYGFLLPARRSYSQFGEDLILKAIFKRIGLQAGVYVDIGAFHPKWLSNTHLLSRSGWAGVVVDIDRDKVELCEKVRRRCLGITAAITPDDETADVAVYKFNRLWSEIDTLSEEEAIRYRSSTGIDFTVEQVPARGIHWVLRRAIEEFGPVDFLNVDIEGVDEQIIMELDLDAFHIPVICFENNRVFGGTPDVVKKLEACGYGHLASAGGSHLYVMASLVSPPGN